VRLSFDRLHQISGSPVLNLKLLFS